VRLVKLGHVALTTPDLETSVGFFRDVVGLEEVERTGGSVYLRAWGEWDHHTLVLTAGEESLVEHIAWRAGAPAQVRQFSEALRAAGTEVEHLQAGEEAGQGEAIRFALPSGHRFEIYYEMLRTPAPPGHRSTLKSRPGRAYARGISPRRIDHVNINVPEPAGVHAWLAEHLGFQMRERLTVAGEVLAGWMSVTPLAHDIAVIGEPLGRRAMLHHLAYYCDNPAEVLRAAEVVREHGLPIEVGPGKHGGTEGFFLYLRDPGSRHRVEIFSGGYLVFDPDWQPVEWTAEEIDDLMVWYGPRLPDTFLGDCTGPGSDQVPTVAAEQA
jgi:catechol 2,3-dioxygenase